VRPAQRCAREGNFFRAEGLAVGLGGAGAVGRALADLRLADHQGGHVGGGGGQFQRVGHGGHVVPVNRAHHLPAHRGKTQAHVVGEPGLDLAVDADAVVVVQGHQLVELEARGQRNGFVADAFHQAAVAHEDIGVVVHHGVAGAVEFGGQQLFSQRHAHRVGQALAQRAGGGFHARGHVHLGVARGLAVQLSEAAQLAHRQFVAGEVQQRIQQHGGVAVAQHKAVAVGPMRVQRVVLEPATPQRHGHLGHAQRCAGVSGIGLLDGIHRQRADRVGHQGGVVSGGGHGRALRSENHGF
jgi:hypothetical protein